jgi:hypothetical protein
MSVSNSFKVSFQLTCISEKAGKIKLSLFLFWIDDNEPTYTCSEKEKIFEKELGFLTFFC